MGEVSPKIDNDWHDEYDVFISYRRQGGRNWKRSSGRCGRTPRDTTERDYDPIQHIQETGI